MPDLRKITRKVVNADYSSKHGVKLRLSECGHEVFIQGFPRSKIPPCFSIACKECAH